MLKAGTEEKSKSRTTLPTINMVVVRYNELGRSAPSVDSIVLDYLACNPSLPTKNKLIQAVSPKPLLHLESSAHTIWIRFQCFAAISDQALKSL